MQRVAIILSAIVALELALILARLLAEPMVALRNDTLEQELARCRNTLSTPDDPWLGITEPSGLERDGGAE